MLTRANIAYNLHNSPHLLEMDYEGQKVVYHFSSDLYKVKFLSRCEEHRESIEDSLSKRFGCVVKAVILADLRLYSTIEKRGFLITVDGDEYECQNNIILDGMKVIQGS